MKAAIFREYGPPESVVHIEDVAKPAPKDDEVLIKVRAASVNPLDCIVLGKPYLARLMMGGLSKPKETRLGRDVAGEIESVGARVAQFKPGDAVFGLCLGAFAEYACASADKIASKPPNLAFDAAATMPIAGLTALQGLRDHGRIQKGHQVLTIGASGGVGTFAIQIAKSFGAEVTAVCSTRNLDLVRSIGADHAIDYTRQDFTAGPQRYDLIFDLASSKPISSCKRLLTPRGRYVFAGAIARQDASFAGPLVPFLKTLLASRFDKEHMGFVSAKANAAELAILADLAASGKIKPVIDKSYPLSQLPEALSYLATKHARGKVVLTMG